MPTPNPMMGVFLRVSMDSSVWTALAQRARVSQGFISQLKRGQRRDDKARVLPRIATILGVLVAELLG